MLALIASSLLLMLMLQVFWVRNVWQDEAEQFEKKIDMSFHGAIQAVQDSIFKHSIKPVSESQLSVMDIKSSDTFPAPISQFKLDSPRVTIYTKNYYYQRNYNPKNEPDEESQYKNRKIRIQFHAKRDSMRGVFRSVIKNIHESSKQTHFVVNLENDSLPIDTLMKKVKPVLDEISGVLPFEIKASDNPHDLVEKEKTQTTPCFAVTTQKFYTANFDDIRPYLLQKVAPHILFSLFQLLLTVAAFTTIFRNWAREEKLLKIKNDFISNITHELKTPIATIGIALEALKRYDALKNPQLAEDYLNISQNELNRLSLLVENVMRTALLEQRDFSLKITEFDWKDLAEKTIFSMQILFEKYGATFTADFTGENFSQKGDIFHLNNVLYNLFDNALKYGGEKPEISLRIEDLGQNVLIAVADKGIGIAPAEQKRIFDKFYRVRHGDTHDVKGYGLGLSYVSEVVKKHGGKIWTESELGKGSTFYVLLPR